MKKDSVSYSYKDFFEEKQKPKRWEALYNLVIEVNWITLNHSIE